MTVYYGAMLQQFSLLIREDANLSLSAVFLGCVLWLIVFLRYLMIDANSPYLRRKLKAPDAREVMGKQPLHDFHEGIFLFEDLGFDRLSYRHQSGFIKCLEK